jgi:hypothetical protein
VQEQDVARNDMQVGWLQLARQVRIAINWLKEVQMENVSETKERRATRMGRDWGKALSRGRRRV